jgi:hypothetical protein
MAKPLALLNQDMAQAYRLHSLTSPPEAFELTDLDKDLLQTLLNKNVSSRQKINTFYEILNRYKNVLGQFHDSNVRPAPPIPEPPPPLPASAVVETKPADKQSVEEEIPVAAKKASAPKANAEKILKKLLEDVDSDFNIGETAVKFKKGLVPIPTWKNLMKQFVSRSGSVELTEPQRNLAGIIYNIINTHPEFHNALKQLPGFERYIVSKKTMTTRSDETSPVKLRSASESTISNIEPDEEESFHEMEPSPPKKKKGKGISKKAKFGGGMVHMKRWEKYMKNSKRSV